MACGAYVYLISALVFYSQYVTWSDVINRHLSLALTMTNLTEYIGLPVSTAQRTIHTTDDIGRVTSTLSNYYSQAKL